MWNEMQIVGARHDDLGVLQLARAYEQMRSPQRAWPQPPTRPAADTRAA